MLRIRLRRTGKAKQPSYRIVVADQRAPRDGAFVEILGHYNPRTDPTTFVIDEERAKHWLAQGALPTETLHRLFHKQGLIETAPPQRPTKQSRAEREAEAAVARAAEDAAAEAAAAEAAAAEAASTADSNDADGDASTDAAETPDA